MVIFTCLVIVLPLMRITSWYKVKAFLQLAQLVDARIVTRLLRLPNFTCELALLNSEMA